MRPPHDPRQHLALEQRIGLERGVSVTGEPPADVRQVEGVPARLPADADRGQRPHQAGERRPVGAGAPGEDGRALGAVGQQIGNAQTRGDRDDHRVR